MARPTDDPSGAKKKKESYTIAQDHSDRIQALKARTGLSASTIADRAFARALPIFENDPGELMRNEES